MRVLQRVAVGGYWCFCYIVITFYRKDYSYILTWAEYETIKTLGL